MKAVAIVAKGQLRQIEVPTPTVASGRTTIRVRCVGLNRLDAMVLNGELAVDLPVVPGADVVGDVVESPDGRFGLGTRVIVNPGLPEIAGQPWPTDRKVPYVRILGLHEPGGLAEFIAVDDGQVYEAPASLSDEEAVTLPLDYLTAWRMLVSKAHVAPGERVLVWGASGPLGCAAIAIARHFGARPIAVSGRPNDRDVLLQLGAEAWLDYHDPALVETIRADIGDPQIVFESVGKDTWPMSLELISQGGRIVICGTTSGGKAEVDLEELYYKQVSLLGSRMGYPDEFEAMLDAVQHGDLPAAPIAARVPMTKAAEAFGHLEHRTAAGKIIVHNDL